MKKLISKLCIVLFWAALAGITCIAAVDVYVIETTKSNLYEKVENIPHNKVGLLLGTSKYLKGGEENYYFRYRIDAAVRLIKAGKIDYILVSGDNRTHSYNEPKIMRADLIKRGIPKEKIIADYAGLRTFDSVIRCKEIFGQSSVTIISQRFHNERALFIARYKGMNAVGFNAKGVSFRYGAKTEIRELAARIKMGLDLICNEKPKYMGKKIHIF